ncbi:MAG: PAS domain S-box protein [Acidobacteria bacterium]|jgi:two-component system sensor histidine kinase PilS (NtrC family)|nr:PAS domain S-box protein [Acidobacteriota bacterium]
MKPRDLHRHLFELLVLRVIVLLVWLNVSDRLGLLPEEFLSYPFLPFFHLLTLCLSLLYLVAWFGRRFLRAQLVVQAGADLALTTVLIACTRGIESPFVSFYLLIIIYSSLLMGRNGGILAAALSTILYSATLIAPHFGIATFPGLKTDTLLCAFRIAGHALGFWAVAFLATYLYRRLRLVENELREKIDSLEQLQYLNEHIIRSIRSGLVTTDLWGTIATFNDAACELTGREEVETLGMPVERIISTDFWRRVRSADLLGSARALRHEEWIELPGGARSYLGFSVSPLLGADRGLIGYIISFQDLTEIHRLEEEVRLKERMAAIGRMAAGIAHEIRNPLTALRGSAEILKSRASLPERDTRLLDILIRESDRLNTFIEDFLDFARPKTYAREPLDLVPFLNDSVTLLKNSPEIRAKYLVTLKEEIPSIPILGSADRLRQVFWNLAQNAIRAMPDGGELTITARGAPDWAGEVVFEDHGIGMTPEELERLFQPFNSGFSNGMGLGLSIIFQIMEEHRGKINFESAKGKGTKVHLLFPLESDPAGAGAECAGQPDAG